MRRKDEKTKFYVEMDGRWVQLSGSEQGIPALIQRTREVRPRVRKGDIIHIIHLN